MKKRIVISLALALLTAVSAFAFAACSGKASGTATAFTLVHGHYVGRADIEVKNGEVTKLTLDEMEMPYTWAKISLSLNKEGDNLEDVVNEASFADMELKLFGTTIDRADVQFGTISKRETKNAAGAVTKIAYTCTYFLKQIKIGNEVLTIANNAGNYSNAKITDLEKFVKVDANGKWYWDQMAEGNYDVYKANGTTKINVDFSRTATDTTPANTKQNRFQKSVNGYGASWSGGEGWTNNMKAISDFVVGKDGAIFEQIVQMSGSIWKVGDTDTEATLTDMYDYYLLVANAYMKV